MIGLLSLSLSGDQPLRFVHSSMFSVAKPTLNLQIMRSMHVRITCLF